MKKNLFAVFALFCGLCLSGAALAEPVGLEVSVNAEASIAAPAAEVLDTGTTAWMMTAAALVIMMCIPGLAMFYAGMVNAKNTLSVFSQFFASAGIICILWVVFGYSIATDATGMEEGVFNLHSFVGGTGAFFLAHMTADSIVSGMPESVLVTFLLAFAIITPAIVAGGFA